MRGVDRVPLLEAEVLCLKNLVYELQERVSDLETRAEFEVVGEKPRASQVVEAPSAYSSFAQLPVEVPHRVVGSQSIERVRVLQKIGKWLRQALIGKRSGTSGREVLKEPSSWYLVARDFFGRDLQPAAAFSDWSSAARLVKPRGQLGQSLCIGLPSREDCEVVAVWAGLELPAHFINGESQ